MSPLLGTEVGGEALSPLLLRCFLSASRHRAPQNTCCWRLRLTIEPQRLHVTSPCIGTCSIVLNPYAKHAATPSPVIAARGNVGVLEKPGRAPGFFHLNNPDVDLRQGAVEVLGGV